MKIELNGKLAYEGKLGGDDERTFGLFHYRNRTAAHMRKIVLTGNWPKAVGNGAEFALTAKPANPATAVARRRLLGGRFFASESGAIAARAATLPPVERYQMLADWVLPAESRPEFQLAGIVEPQQRIGCGRTKARSRWAAGFAWRSFDGAVLGDGGGGEGK